MTDSDYLSRAEAVLAAVERAVDEADADIELERSGNVLTLEFENRTKIIVNLQPPMSEIWIAAKAGGFHYRFQGGEWRDTRTGTVFFRGVDAAYATQRDVSRTKRDIKTFEVRLRCDNRDGALAVGMTAYVVLPFSR